MDVKEIISTVKEYIQNAIQTKEPVMSPEWITNGIMADHSQVDGEDSDFCLVGCRAFVRNEVRKIFNKQKIMGIEEEFQMVLDGFEHLQEYYTIERDKERCFVRIDNLTDDELMEKAVEYQKMSESCAKHAREILTYIEERKQSRISN